MDSGSVVWLVVFGVAALVFFGIAAIVAVKGFQDLRDLLFHSRKGKTDA